MQTSTEISLEAEVLLPPGYEERLSEELIRRVRLVQAVGEDCAKQAIALEQCRAEILTFFNDWLWTYDPRMVALNLPADLPFVLRPHQADYIQWLADRERTQTSGLVEKSRDEGASYLTLAFDLHHWLFIPGYAAAWGSRKEELVDKIGDPKTLFWKLRYMLYALPKWFLPEGFTRKEHDNFMRLVNPANNASITGEAGDNMGRGGRATAYRVDEWAHVEHAEMVNAAISQNSNTRVKIFTPNGVGNVAYQERFSGKFPVFTFNWRDNPDKNYTASRVNEKGEVETYYPWYEKQERELDPVTLAQEVDIDYTASAEGIVIPARWVQAAVGLALQEGAVRSSGLDVSEDGADKTVYAHRRGGVLKRIKEIGGTNPAHKASDAEQLCREDETGTLYYDRLGVGAGITATLKAKEGKLPFKVVGVANSEKPTRRVFEDQPRVPADERFANYAAELWWSLRLRFKRTYERVNGIKHHLDDECISIPNNPALIAQLCQPIYKKNSSDKIVVDKKGQGTKSPDHAEACMYTFASPAEHKVYGSTTITI